jgi:hypothetical protein
MTTTIARSNFNEGQILAAADLNATVDYARNQMARHARYEHSWGILTGLELTSSFTVTAGIAIDGTGREIVVPADYALLISQFNVFPQPDAATLYPVFLNGVDQAAAASSNPVGVCGSSQSTSTQETFQITFGAPGSELSVAGQTLPAITDPPDGGTTQPWLVLLGYVTWDATKSQFSGVSNTNPASGVERRYAGVNASSVISQSGELLLATDPATPPGPNPVMAIQITETPAQFVFGTLGTNGSVTPALTVTASGDVTATGQVKGAVTPGSMQVQSGVAFDGMILPLPVGIKWADVAAGRATVHTHVTVRFDNPTPPDPAYKFAIPQPCNVNGTTGQISSRLQWVDPAMGLPSVLSPAACDYLAIAAVAASS